MKTAMQELKDWANQYKGQMISADQVVLKAHNLLKKEKDQIVNAFEVGYKSCDIDEALEINMKLASGEQHYNKTYNL